jgi:hypothetical protein
MKQPRIAVILDENTSGDGTRYEAWKGLFKAIRDGNLGLKALFSSDLSPYRFSGAWPIPFLSATWISGSTLGRFHVLAALCVLTKKRLAESQ